MVAVIGRRRVGKTYLIRSVCEDRIRFETSGVQNAGLKEQLNNFNFQLKSAFGDSAPSLTPKTWQETFFSLITCWKQAPSMYQKVLFFDELEMSGFISAYPSFEKKKKDLIYRLTDEYSLFYLKFIEDQQHQVVDTWQHLSQTQTFKTWSGYAFENICLKHISQIKKSLGISGIYTQASTFYQKGQGNEQGVQIDLLLDRNDNSINLCEIEFYADPLVFTKTQAVALRTERALFKHYPQSRKQIFLSLISTYGIIDNEKSTGLIDNVITLDALFD